MIGMEESKMERTMRDFIFIMCLLILSSWIYLGLIKNTILFLLMGLTILICVIIGFIWFVIYKVIE